ncbi:MAG: hypothetical protein ACM3IJ_02880 [Candidatus Levyibacteriota bacterium]
MVLETREKSPAIEKDPLAEERKIAKNIARNLAQRDACLTISVLGTLHVGNIGEGIKDSIDWATSVSAELPSIAVDGYLQAKGFPHSVSELRSRRRNKVQESTFWRQTIDYCRQTGTPVGGVNNHKAGIDSMRILDGRIPERFRPGRTKPSAIFSTRDPELATHLEKQGSEYLQRRFSTYAFYLAPETIPMGADYISLEPRRPFPYTGVEEVDGSSFYYHQYKFPDWRSNIAVVSGKYALPVEYMMEFAQLVFGGRESQYIDQFEIAQKGIDHLIRLRVDKAQVEGVLKPINKLLQDPRSAGCHMHHLHIGGAIHNANIEEMFRDLFTGVDRVSVYAGVDERMPQPYEDSNTLFSSLMSVREGLSATKTQYDHVLVDIGRASHVFSQSVRRVGVFTQAGQVREAERRIAKKSDNGAYFEYYTANALLQLLPPRGSGDPLQLLDNFPDTLANTVKAQAPEKADQVDAIMDLYERRKEYFPKQEERSGLRFFK